jgi:FixJ family two-component response regulator
MMTGYSNMSFVIECLSQGACDYFAKPFIDLNILVNAVKNAIERINRWKKGIGIEVRSA